MILQQDQDDPIVIYNPEVDGILPTNYPSVSPQNKLLRRRPKKGPRQPAAPRRMTRNQFFKQIAGVWKNRTPNAGGAFDALAAKYSPWENWLGDFITPTAYQMYQIYMCRFFELAILNVLEPLDVDIAFSPWPTDWPDPVNWGVPTIDYGFTPPHILWPYTAPLDTQRVSLLTVYLAAPYNRTVRDEFEASYRVWTNNSALLARTATLYTWEFPDYGGIYPGNLPTDATRAAMRPNDGSYFSAEKGSRVLLPYSPTVQRFTLDHPAPP